MRNILGSIQVKPNWDEKVSWYKDVPDSAISLGLEAYSQITSFLVRNNSGSLIVSGERGVGKTTTVISAVRDCEKRELVFPVYLNTLHLEAFGESDAVDLRMQKLLRLLIRSLANEIAKNGIVSKELAQLIHDCDATTLSKSHTFSSAGKLHLFSKFQASLDEVMRALGATGFKLESGANTDVTFEEANKNIWKKDGISIEDIVDRFSTIIKKLENHDAFNTQVRKPRTLSIRLLGRELVKLVLFPQKVRQKRKLVFVLDELDVYDGDGKSNIKPLDVLNTIKRFKNLFTLSNAHFIFIVGKQTYLQAKFDPYRTLFSERCFLSTPNGEKLTQFLDSIVVDEVPKKLANEWEEIKWFLISRSRHNLYELVTLVNANCRFDEKSKKYYFDLPNRSPAERAITSIHCLVNAVFIFHQQSSDFEHFNDDLFEELLSIENKFKHYLFSNDDTDVSLGNVVEINEEGINKEEVKAAIREAKAALVRTLHLYLNRQAPTLTSLPSIKIPWSELRDALTFKEAKKGILGAVTKSEIAFHNGLETLLNDLRNRYQPFTSLNLLDRKPTDVIREVYKLLNLEVNESYLDFISKAVEQTKNLPVDKRDWNTVIQADQGLVAIHSQMDNYKTLSNNLIARTEWGQITFDEKGAHLGSDTSHGNKLMSNFVIELPKPKKGKSIEVIAKVKLSQDSLLNFLFYVKGAPTEVERDFYMARYDGRKSNYDCLLYKPSGHYWSEVPDSTPQQRSSQVGVWFEVRIILKNGYIEMKKKQSGGYRTIAKAKIDIDCVAFGIANEVNTAEVDIQNIKIGKESFGKAE